MPTASQESFIDFIKTESPELEDRASPFTPKTSSTYMTPTGEGPTPPPPEELVLAELDSGPVLLPPTHLDAYQLRILRSLAVRRDYVAIEREALRWRRATLGLRQAPSAEALTNGGTDVSTPPGGPRSLLLLHGIFSHAAETFRGLATDDFYQHLSPVYGDRIYAFNHLTASQPIETSARQLLEALPPAPTTYDVIAHSRGGLVVRALVERGHLIAPGHHQRFKLGRAVLACVPNRGTNLITDQGFEALLTVLSQISPGITFTRLLHLLRLLRDDLPGLTDMLPTSTFINAFPSIPPTALSKYAAIAVDFESPPFDNRIDQIIGPANDLAVPTPECTKVGRPPSQIANNLTFSPALPSYPSQHQKDSTVWHSTVFEQRETHTFITQHLSLPM